jgi:hypothetical protein
VTSCATSAWHVLRHCSAASHYCPDSSAAVMQAAVAQLVDSCALKQQQQQSSAVSERPPKLPKADNYMTSSYSNGSSSNGSLSNSSLSNGSHSHGSAGDHSSSNGNGHAADTTATPAATASVSVTNGSGSEHTAALSVAAQCRLVTPLLQAAVLTCRALRYYLSTTASRIYVFMCRLVQCCLIRCASFAQCMPLTVSKYRSFMHTAR